MKRPTSLRAINRFRLLSFSVVTALVITPTACSGASDDPEARRVANEFVNAMVNGDESKAVELTSDMYRSTYGPRISDLISELRKQDAEMESEGLFLEQESDFAFGPQEPRYEYVLSVNDEEDGEGLFWVSVTSEDGALVVSGFGYSAYGFT